MEKYLFVDLQTLRAFLSVKNKKEQLKLVL